MTLYMTQARLTPEAWQAIYEGHRDRREVMAEMLEEAGGKLISYYFAFGDSDVVLIMDAPDNETAASAGIAVARAGVVTDIRTTVLMGYEEGVRAIERSSRMGYVPPGR